MSVDSLVVVYDCSRLERIREFKMDLTFPSSLFLMSDKNTIVVGDANGLQTVNIILSKAGTNLKIGKVNALQKLNTKDQSKQPVFAACTEDGSIRIYKDSEAQSSGLDEVKKLTNGKKN